MDFWPGPLILAALCASLSILLLLLFFSRVRVIENCGSRYLASALGSLAVFGLGCALAWTLAPRPGEFWVEFLPACAIVFTAIMLFETFWSLLAFGFTMNILLCLHECPGGLGLDGLKAALGAGQGVDAVLANRLQMLKKAGLVRESSAGLVLAGLKGRLMALVGRFIYAVYNIDAEAQA